MKEKEVLQAIIKFIEENKISPTVREIADITDLKSTSSVHRYLKNLEKKGNITRLKDCPRSIRVIGG